MEVIVVKGVGARTEYRRESFAGGGKNMAQKAALLIGALPAVLDRHFAPARSLKAATSSALPKACSEMLRAGLAVHAAA